MIRRMPPSDVPFAVIAKVEFSCLRTQKVPEAQADFYQQYGWIVIARDSEHPLTLGPGQMYDAAVRRLDRMEPE